MQSGREGLRRPVFLIPLSPPLEKGDSNFPPLENGTSNFPPLEKGTSNFLPLEKGEGREEAERQGGFKEEAFSVSERMKARSFLEELNAARAAREGIPESLLEKKRLLEARMRRLRNQTQPVKSGR